MKWKITTEKTTEMRESLRNVIAKLLPLKIGGLSHVNQRVATGLAVSLRGGGVRTAIALAGVMCIFGCNHSRAEDRTVASIARTEPKLVVPVTSGKLALTTCLPGELRAFRDVAIHAKVEGFISWIGVDRGSFVKSGQPMIKVSCPELDEKLREAEARKAVAESTLKEGEARYQSELERKSEAQCRYDSDQLTASRLAEANKTPGAVAQNDVDQAQKKAEGDASVIHAIEANVKATAALVASQRENINATEKVLKSVQNMQAYLTIRAPFVGVITERNVHEGSIVAVESSKSDRPLVRIQDRQRLRLVVAVPESAVSGIVIGKVLTFSVPAFLGRKFTGVLRRPGYALNDETRTMPVELDVDNSKGELQPGMYARVEWKESRAAESLFVPVSSVGTDLKGSFVIVVRNNKTSRITVTTGSPMGNQIEINGNVRAGDVILLRADDRVEAELTEGTRVATSQEISAANKRSAGSGE